MQKLTTTSSTWSIVVAVLNVTKIMMGASFLSLPYAMARSGYVYTCVLIVLNGFFNNYTARILARSCCLNGMVVLDSKSDNTMEQQEDEMNENTIVGTDTLNEEEDIDSVTDGKHLHKNEIVPSEDVELQEIELENEPKPIQIPEVHIDTYQEHTQQGLTYCEAARLAYGRIGEFVTAAFILLADLGACAAYFIVAAESLNQVYSRFSPGVYMLLSLVIILPFVFMRDVQKLSFMGFVGMATFMGLVVVVLVYGLKLDRTNIVTSVTDFKVVTPSFYIAYGICKFSFCGHEVFCFIRQSMPSEKSFNTAMNISCLFIAVSALVIGTAGFTMFSSTTPEYIMQNFPKSLVFSAVVRVVVSIMIIASIPITIFAACELVEYYIKHVFSRWKHYRYINTEEKLIPRMIIRTIIVLLSIVLAVAIPNFTKQVSLVGAVADSCLGLILPCLIYPKLFWGNMRWYTIALAAVILLFGFYGVACGILVFILE
jgi:amino acid permease